MAWGSGLARTGLVNGNGASAGDAGVLGALSLETETCWSAALEVLQSWDGHGRETNALDFPHLAVRRALLNMIGGVETSATTWSWVCVKLRLKRVEV